MTFSVFLLIAFFPFFFFCESFHVFLRQYCFSLSLRSIEFDRDFDYFAIAGVTKKIKVLPKLLTFACIDVCSKVENDFTFARENP